MRSTLPLAAVLLLTARPAALAQRPDNASICDYYATAQFGTNSTTTQYRLMQSIITAAYVGGANLSNASPDMTGILNPGSFGGRPVNLKPWFDGSSRCCCWAFWITASCFLRRFADRRNTVKQKSRRILTTREHQSIGLMEAGMRRSRPF